MKHVSILIPNGETSLSNIEATYKLFTKVNEVLLANGGAPLFQVTLVGLSRETSVADGRFTISP